MSTLPRKLLWMRMLSKTTLGSWTNYSVRTISTFRSILHLELFILFLWPKTLEKSQSKSPLEFSRKKSDSLLSKIWLTLLSPSADSIWTEMDSKKKLSTDWVNFNSSMNWPMSKTTDGKTRFISTKALTTLTKTTFLPLSIIKKSTKKPSLFPKSTETISNSSPPKA